MTYSCPVHERIEIVATNSLFHGCESVRRNEIIRMSYNMLEGDPRGFRQIQDISTRFKIFSRCCKILSSIKTTHKYPVVCKHKNH